MTIQDIPVPKQPVFLVQDEKAFFDSFDRALGFSGEFSKPFRRNGDDDGAVDGVWMGQLRRQARSGDAASCYWLGRFLVEPEQAHAPLIGEGTIHKAIFKVKVA